jgi:hypothetical protein
MKKISAALSPDASASTTAGVGRETTDLNLYRCRRPNDLDGVVEELSTVPPHSRCDRLWVR